MINVLVLAALFLSTPQVRASQTQCDQVFTQKLSSESVLQDLQTEMATFIDAGKILNANKVSEIAKQILQIQPNHSEARMKLTLSSMSLGRFGDAQKALTQALEDSPHNPTLKILLAKALSKKPSGQDPELPLQIANSLYLKGGLQEIEWSNLGSLAIWLNEIVLLEKIIQKMTQEYPETEKALKLELELLNRRKDFQSVITKSQILTESQSKDFEIVGLKARALYEMKKYYDAITLIDAHVPVDKRPSSLDFTYAEALFKSRNPEKALLAIQRAIARKNTPNRHFFKLRYQLLKSLRQYDEAIQQLEQISYHFPKDSFLSNAFMEIYFLKSSSLKKTNPDESSVLLEKSYQIVLQALQSNPNNEFLKKYHARILLRQDRYEEALVILNELQQRNPSASDYDEMAAVANLRLDRFENALRHSQRLYSMDSEDPVNLDHLARSLIGLGRYQEAAETIEKGILNGLSDNLTWINLAKAYEMLNEYDKAIEILQVIQKKETHNYFVKNTLNRVQEKKRNNDKEKK